MDLTDLLEKAGEIRAWLSSPWRLHSPAHAAELAGEFFAIETQVSWQPSSSEKLRELVGHGATDPKGRHRYMAGLMLARSDDEAAARTLLDASGDPDPAVAHPACLNVRSLVRSKHNRAALSQELTEALEAGDAPRAGLVADALAAQRAASTDELLERYFASERDSTAARALVTSVCGRVSGADRLLDAVHIGNDPVGIAAIGLQAIFVDADRVGSLRELAGHERADTSAEALRWLGRCPHPTAVPPLLTGLEHPDSNTRLDTVNCLALYGTHETWRGVVTALHDPDPIVAGTAVHHLAQLLGEAFTELGLDLGPSDELAPAAANRLAAAAEAVLPARAGGRSTRRGPLDARHQIDLVYLSYLPGIVWLQLNAAYAPGVPFDPHQDLVGNMESIHELEMWAHEWSAPTSRTGWTFHGNVV